MRHIIFIALLCLALPLSAFADDKSDLVNGRKTLAAEVFVELKNENDKAARLVDDKKFGMTKKERMELFTAQVKLEDQAEAEAEKKYPVTSFCASPSVAKANMNRNIEYARNRKDELLEKLHKRYKITEEQASEISVEGGEQNWPIPDMPDRPACR